MPAYNAAATIGAAIESVLRQSRGDFELIVVDDASTDDTSARVQAYLADQRVKLIRQAKGGVAVARNAAIEASRGELISLLDSDDLWLPNYLETMHATLAADPAAGVAYTDAWVLHDGTHMVERRSGMSHTHPRSAPNGPDAFLRALLEYGNFIFVSATIRREVLAAVGAFRQEVAPSEDYELWLRIAAHGYRFVRSPLKLAVHRRRRGQASEDPETMRRASNEVFRLVTDEYDVPDDIRELARKRIPMRRIRTPRPRRVPPPLRPAYTRIARLRRFYVRPPLEIRRAFPDLRSL
jgi:glycosyltransferase involved in cell wall biosynthesis